MRAIIAILKWLLPPLLLLSAVTLPLGFTLPMLAVDRLWLFVERPSLFEVIEELWVTGERGLAAIVTAFSVVLPILKLLALFYFCFGGPGGRRLLILDVIAKWSMMDVMLVAIVIFAAKTSGLATAVTLPGIWFYGTAAISAALAATIASLLAERARADARLASTGEPDPDRLGQEARPEPRGAPRPEHTRSSAREPARPALRSTTPRRILPRLPPIPTSKL